MTLSPRQTALAIGVPLFMLLTWTWVSSMVTCWGIGVLDDLPWGLPTWQWWGYFLMDLPAGPQREGLHQWLGIGAVTGGLFQVAVLFRIVTTLRGWGLLTEAEDALYGRAAFATREEAAKVGIIHVAEPRRDGLILGLDGKSYVQLLGNDHVLAYAKTGSGKGVSIVIPNCMNTWGSLVVLDIKGEAADASAGYRQNVLGQEVFIFAPHRDRSHCWNPYGGVSTADPGYLDRLEAIAMCIFPKVEGKEGFWQDGARNIWYGISIFVAETPGLNLDPGTIFEIFSRPDGIERTARIIIDARTSGYRYSQVSVNLIADFRVAPEESSSGWRNQIKTSLGALYNPKFRAMLATSHFSLRDLRRKKISVYLTIMPADLERYGVFLRLFFTQLYMENTDAEPKDDPTLKHSCMVMLDEFNRLPPMKAIAEGIGDARGFGLQICLVLQSKGSITEKYKNNGAAALLGNPGVEIVFGTDEPQIVKEISERCGNNTVAATSRSAPYAFPFLRPYEKQTQERDASRPLMLRQEVSGMDPALALVFRSGCPPLKLRRVIYYTDRTFGNLKVAVPLSPAVVAPLARDDGSVAF